MTIYNETEVFEFNDAVRYPEDDKTCENSSEVCGCGCDCEEDEFCDCEHDTNGEETTIVMTDSEGKEYEFMLYDEIQYNDETYLLLLTRDDEDPELVIVKVIEGEDGNDSLVSVDEDEFDQVFAEYERLCDETQEDEDDDEDNEEA